MATRTVRRHIVRKKAPISTVEDRLKRVWIKELTATDQKPSKITEYLFLGSVGAAYTKEVLTSLNITHILTVCNILPPRFPKDYMYKVVPITDEPTTKISLHFNECADWIDQVH